MTVPQEPSSADDPSSATADRPTSEQAKTIFLAALEIAASDERKAFIADKCDNDESLRREVGRLLSYHDDVGSFLQSPPPGVGVDPTADQSTVAALGSQIGPYKLLQELGEGGMGIVYLAERLHPVKQRVALKVIKQGMDSKKFIARFEAERQALAMMDHPNIAKVLDAGCTENGRPYFVMELVKGVTISRFCDEDRLTTRERLELFEQVCHAVHHAHQKGIIHRDLKPSNVLVALYDDKPVPKVIDFGVAKATNQQLTDKTLFTEVGSILGTWEYMSPEQAVLNQLDVDTRTDVYSLGVLLYELLTGETPIDRQRLREAQIMETLRMIREDEPPKPSTRVSSMGDKASTMASYRRVKPETLASEIRGDLDWIVMKALAKERSRRYDSANRFAEDLRRYLNHELIEARPPSAWYQIQKLYQRNKSLALGIGAVICALSIGLILAVAANTRLAATQQELEDQYAKLDATLVSLIDSTMREAIVSALGGDQAKAEEALQVVRNIGARDSAFANIEADVLLVEGLIALNRADYDEAIRLAELSRNAPTSIQSDGRVGAVALLYAAALWGGKIDVAEPASRTLLDAAPEYDVEKLIQAYAIAGFHPVESLQILEANPTIERTPVGMFIRGQANYMVAVDQGDREQLWKALDDLKTADFLLRDSEATTMWRVLALTLAIHYSQIDGEPDKANEYERQGLPLARKLRGIAATEWVQWGFYDAIGSLDDAFQACKDHSTERNSDFLAIECLLRDDFPQALVRFNEIMRGKNEDTKYARLARAHLARGENDGAQTIREMALDLLKDPSPFICRHALAVLCLACNVEEIEEFAKESQNSISEEMHEVDELWQGEACVRYYAGRITADDLIALAGNHRFTLANVHCTIAMKALAAGNREEALDHFQAAVDTETYQSSDFELARAYLTRMKADRHWPHWMHDKTHE